ncbi:hypothetical protein RN001_013777 [Aquatica leii]|uniref:Peptidase S1 domain-containing protein n=1 Tax=Aquatica leii TaxID=1421715 RepID=A0AAN7PS64_9COLE|nr:hypothetical protein RN001_013777 [Aquatica leii]
MKVIFVFPLVFAAVASFPRYFNILLLGLSPRIISGQDAILGQFPWQVLNRYVVPAGRGLCGGALVDPRWVLTAAHCADGISDFEITLGSLYSDGRDEPQATTIKASFAYVHIDFNSLSLENDVAVIDLVQGVALTNFIQTIPLGFDEIGSGVRLVASGWGKTSDSGSVSSILKYVGLDTISNDECAIIYGSITDGSLCCRGAPEHSTCKLKFGILTIFLGLSSKIIDGENAELGQFRWQILSEALLSEGTLTCGGSLIDPRWVLTAAHCADRVYSFKITLGSLHSDGRDEPQAVIRRTTRAIIHPDFDKYSLNNDVALIDLQETVYFTASSSLSDTLNYVNLNTITNAECEQIFNNIFDGQLCCRGDPNHSICTGDSGGPLVQYDNSGKAYHVGITSFNAPNGCDKGHPSGFARTSYYQTWILNTMYSKNEN